MCLLQSPPGLTAWCVLEDRVDRRIHRRIDRRRGRRRFRHLDDDLDLTFYLDPLHRIHRVAEATRGPPHVIVNGSETPCPLLSMAATRCAPGTSGGMTNAHPESVPRRSVAQDVARTPSNVTLTARDAAKPRPSMTARVPTMPALGLKLRAGLTLNDALAPCPVLSTALMLCRPAVDSGTVNAQDDS